MEESKDNVQRPFKGIVTDVSPLDQPKETYRYALNGINQSETGNTGFISMESAISECTSFPENSEVLASIYMVDDQIAVFLNDGTYDYIGIINKLSSFTLHVKTQVLNLSKQNVINGTFRMRRNSSRVIYWVDGHNKPRIYNFDRPFDFYSADYITFLNTHSVNDEYTNEKWSEIKFDLIKTYTKIPKFDNVTILNTGNIPSGSYNISIQLVDENLSPTEWINTSNPVNIFVDQLDLDYRNIRGSRNSNSDAQNFQYAAKSIQWTISNLDTNFSFYRVAVLCANGGNSIVNKALVSNLIPIDDNTFVYSGNDGDFTETSVTDIGKYKTDISSAKYIEQLENRMILAGIKGKQIDWCNFQAYASKIKSKLVTKEVSINNIESKGSAKNPITIFDTVGYMWGEVYSFGISYVFTDGYKSPVYHIPGRPSNVNNGMDFYECGDSVYPAIHSCDGNYWGKDGYENSEQFLLSQKIRHHKFPKRTSVPVNGNNTTICGIQFENIEKPHPDIVGFEIVRNERTEDDKTIIDNVLIGAITVDENGPYNTFGLLAPDVPDTNKSRSGFFVFSPEHQFKNKKISFDGFDIQGVYDRVADPYVPTLTNGEGGNGMYLQDVKSGTTFNSSYNKGEDPDGFDLQVLYRSNEFVYFPVSNITIPAKENVLYLSSAANQTINNRIFFNASVDNKIIIVTFDNNHRLPTNLFTNNNKPRLLYGSLIKNNTTAYSNFINRTYYQETNNPDQFTSNTVSSSEIYNGDSYTAPMTINASTYYDTSFADRDKKSRVWKIVLGSVLAVAGIVGAIFTAGASLSLTATGIAIAATTLAITYGVSMATSGIEFETMKNMIDQHYEAGLKVTIQDAVNKDASYIDGTVPDDKFMWFVDRLQNIYFESSINIGLRCGLTIPTSDFVNSPSIQLADTDINFGITAKDSYEVYLANKFTVVDREQNGGRLYTGYASAEFYDINMDYLRKNHEKPNYHLPIEYDCCSVKIENFNNRIFYSEQSFQEEKLDNYRSFLPNNYKDVEGQFGDISGIFRFNNTLYIHTTESLLSLPQNLQERINQELVTFIGTGDFFALSPRKIIDGENGSFGSSDNRATVITRNGVFFVNTNEGIPYLLGQTPKNISAGNSIWFRNNLKVKLHEYIKDIPYEIYNNRIISKAEKVYEPLTNHTVGVRSVYDPVLNRILVTKIDYIPLFKTTQYGSGPTQVGKVRFDPITNKFYRYGDIELPLNNKSYFQNNSWTMSFSLDAQAWISYHSYLPEIYINTPSKLYSSIGSKLYLHHDNTKFCTYYGIKYPHIIEYVSASNPLTTRITDSISLKVDGKRYLSDYNAMINDTTTFFDKVIFSNSKQCSGEMNIVVRTPATNYLQEQVKNVHNRLITEKIEGIWTLNEIRDHLTDYTIPFYLNSWQAIKDVYPIDKVLNTLAFNADKQWYELESLRDSYLIIRLIFSNFGNNTVQLTTNYSIENEQESLR